MGWNEVFHSAHREQAFGEGIGAAHKAQQKWIVPDQRRRYLLSRHLREVLQQHVKHLSKFPVKAAYLLYVKSRQDQAFARARILPIWQSSYATVKTSVLPG